MIYDTLTNAQQYYCLGENIKKGFEFLLTNDLLEFPDGKYVISGDKIFANVQSLATKPKEEKKWEAHRKYIDIQYLIKGEECMGFGVLKNYKNVSVPYDIKKDVEFFESGKHYNYLNLQAGDFTIFYPNDVHACVLNVGELQKIKKVIVKILM